MSFDLETLLRQRAIQTHFQPILSLRKQQVMGVEALSRGVVAVPGQPLQQIPPLVLFECARAEGRLLELDRLCCQTALRSFAQLQQVQDDLILFLNLHLGSVQQGSTQAHDLIHVQQNYGIEPRRIVIEVLEHEIEDLERFKRDIEALRECGFLIALDDVGAGHSNLDRIAFVRPDILKIDRVLTQDIHRDYHKQEVFKSLVNLSEKIGGWTVSEGLETEDDALMALDLGGDMMQGYFFARPQLMQLPLASGEIEYSKDNLQDTAHHFKKRIIERIEAKRSQHEKRVQIVDGLRHALQQAPEDEFEMRLHNVVIHHSLIESVCVLNDCGVQISDTITQMEREEEQKTVIFAPPHKGTDHSMKEYFYCLVEAGIDPFFSNPYVPLPSGDLCVSVATRFAGKHGTPFVLCVHLNAMNSLTLEPEPFALQANRV
jgi:EAL domain-containing protein (putative c-di-GMP-specific phosphodiesterase class I)